MKRSSLLFTLTLLFAGYLVSGQSVYHFAYSFQLPADSVAYNALLVKYDDGTGSLRIRYTEPRTGTDMVVECDMEEAYVIDSLQPLQPNPPLVLRASNRRTIIGSGSNNIPLPNFIFTYRSASGFYEPYGVSTGALVAKMDARTRFAAELAAGPTLSRELVSAFYSEGEDFYVNLFKTVTKGLTAAEKNTRLFVLAVGDTMDSTIGHSCSMDIKRTIETFRGLSDYLGIRYLPASIAGASYSKKNVIAAISNLKPGPNDIVVFYYSGHGFRKAEENRRFPNIKLKTHHTSKQDVLANSMSMEDIYAMIKKKNARFNLVLSDCCNSDIEVINAAGTKPGQTKASGIEWNEDNCRSLFLSKTGMSIIATAADNGQRATSNNDFGGFFSYFFKSSMENYCSKLKNNVTWDQILQDTKTMTVNKAKHTYCDKPYIPANICDQYPFYRIDIGR